MYHDRPLRDQDDDSRDVRDAEAGAYRESTHRTALTPDEVLFRRKNAPERFAEHDVYYANERNLPNGGEDVLPDSDLLKAVHSYSSRFYDAAARRREKAGAHHRPSSRTPLPSYQRTVDERSMDETALLAFGILLEEAGRDVLGRRGDLVFTEAAVDASGAEDEEGALDPDPQRLEYEEEEEEEEEAEGDDAPVEDQENEAVERKAVSQARPKRRKIGKAR